MTPCPALALISLAFFAGIEGGNAQFFPWRDFAVSLFPDATDVIDAVEDVVSGDSTLEAAVDNLDVGSIIEDAIEDAVDEFVNSLPSLPVDTLPDLPAIPVTDPTFPVVLEDEVLEDVPSSPEVFEGVPGNPEVPEDIPSSPEALGDVPTDPEVMEGAGDAVPLPESTPPGLGGVPAAGEILGNVVGGVVESLPQVPNVGDVISGAVSNTNVPGVALLGNLADTLPAGPGDQDAPASRRNVPGLGLLGGLVRTVTPADEAPAPGGNRRNLRVSKKSLAASSST